jgi:hypothetical protein
MKRGPLFALAALLCATSFAAPLSVAGVASAQSAPAYKTPMTSFGQPDLSGNWTNASMTPETRPARFGDRAVYTPEEVKALEHKVVEEQQQDAKPTDPNAPPPTKGGDAPPPGTRPEFVAAGGAVGGYNYGWLDPGAYVMRVNGEPRTSIITAPGGKAPSYKPGVTPPDFRAMFRDVYDNPENRSLGERCIMGFGRNAGPPMLANGFYNNDYQIVQSPDAVAIRVEMVHDVRIIRLNSTHRTDGVRPWMGDSIGHWEGKTLVVETTNIPAAQAYHGSWKDLTVIERFTRVGPDRLLYQFTIHDPTMWAADWGGEYEFHPLKGEIYEYACHEGNYALRNILAGARAKEKETTTTPPASVPAKGGSR